MYDDMIQNFALSSPSSSSFCSNDEFNSDRIQTRLVWITNYKTDVDFPIHVSNADPLVYLNYPSSISNRNETKTLVNHIQTIDLSKLNLDDLLFLLYRLQETTTKNSNLSSSSSISSSSSSDILDHRPSFFTLSNIADLPKQFTKSITSFHSQTSKHVHSPNDVVNKLLQSYHQIPHYTYQQSQQYKANLISHSFQK